MFCVLEQRVCNPLNWEHYSYYFDVVYEQYNRKIFFGIVLKEEHSKLAAQINTTKKLLEELKLEEGEHIDPKAEKLK